MKIDIREYMARKCLCGHERGTHMHGHHRQANGEFALTCIPCGCCACECFVDEFERELGGKPTENPHLGELAREEVTRVLGPRTEIGSN